MKKNYLCSASTERDGNVVVWRLNLQLLAQLLYCKDFFKKSQSIETAIGLVFVCVCVCVCVSMCPNNDFSIKSPLTSTFGRPVNATRPYLGHFRSQDRRSVSRIQIRKQFLGCGCTLRRNVGNLSRSLCSSGHCDPEWRLCRLWISTTH